MSLESEAQICLETETNAVLCAVITNTRVQFSALELDVSECIAYAWSVSAGRSS
jgi:hypothetical protein